MAISINTNDFVKGVSVELDDKKWTYVAPGAGIMLDISRASRKSAELEAKIASGTATDSDREEQIKLVELAFDFYASVLKDETKDNSQVKKWLRETPLDVIAAVVQDIQRQISE